MHLWKQWTTSPQRVAHLLNELELEHWEIFQVFAPPNGDAIVLARHSSTSYEIREALEAGASTDEPEWMAEARDIVASGQKIKAIKLVRGATGWGLKESKAYVEKTFY